MTRDEQLIRAALEMAADEWPNVRVEGGLATAAVLTYADRIRAIDVADVLAKMGGASSGNSMTQQQASLIDLIGEFGREVYYLIDDCETSGPVGDEVHSITTEGLQKVSDLLDRIEALPFEEQGLILGPGAMLQLAIKTLFLPSSPQPAPDAVARLVKAAKALRPYLRWTIGPESPGHHPTMPSAVDAFLIALAAMETHDDQ